MKIAEDNESLEDVVRKQLIFGELNRLGRELKDLKENKNHGK